jgi:hypothetical protein
MPRLLSLLALTVLMIQAPSAVEDVVTITITPEQVKGLFGPNHAKVVIFYPGAENPFDNYRPGPVYLIDLAVEPYQLVPIVSDARPLDGKPIISQDGTRLAYNANGNIFVCDLKRGGPRRTQVGKGFSTHWWVHPKTGSEYLIFVDKPWDNGGDISGKTFMQQIKTGACEPVGQPTVLIDEYAMRGGRSVDGAYICTTQPGWALAKLKPDAVENAFVEMVASGPRNCNASISKSLEHPEWFLWEDPGHNRVHYNPISPDQGYPRNDDTIPIAKGYSHINWLEWSTHGDYFTGSMMNRDDGYNHPGLSDCFVCHIPTRTWVQVTKGCGSSHLWVGKPMKPVKPAATAKADKPKPVAPAPAVVAEWDLKLLEAVRQRLASGKALAFQAASLKERFDVTGVSETGELMLSGKIALRLAVGRLKVGDRSNLALAVVDDQAANQALAAFYLLASNGPKAEAERYLQAAGPEADVVRSAFSAPAPAAAPGQ